MKRLLSIQSVNFQHVWMNMALFIFLLVAVLGTILRLIYVTPISFLPYKYILHAHSHISILGWAFMLVSGILVFLVLKSNSDVSIKKYRVIFWLAVISTFGMLFFFTLQGYGLYSIIFSTLHVLTSYLFCYYSYCDLKKIPKSSGKVFIQWALFWMVLSTIGIWMIGPISAVAGKSSVYFYMAIQFFLHFQFMGWFTYSVLGIWILRLEKKHPHLTIPNTYFWLLHISLLLTYALSVMWSTPLSIVFYLNSVGVMIQGVAFYLILKKIFRYTNPFKNLRHWTDWLFAIGVFCLLFKVIIQAAVALPMVAEISYTIRNYVIGFVHLIMLGSVTFPLVAILLKENLLTQNHVTQKGWQLFTLGFILKEATLFIQGSLLWMKKGFLPYYHELILGVTTILPVALITVWIGQLNRRRFETDFHIIKHK